MVIIKMCLDANYQVGIYKCEECSAHEDAGDPPVCLVCDDAKILPADSKYGYPDWCPLTNMMVIDTDIETRTECLVCGYTRLKKIIQDGVYQFSACRQCGIRYYKEVPK